jgi:hypothetical protein
LWDEVGSQFEFNLVIDPNLGPDALRHSIQESILLLRAELPELRRKLCGFRCEGSALPNEKTRLVPVLERVWDGIRNLPFTSEQIARCLAQTIALYRHHDRGKLFDGREWYGVFDGLIPTVCKVGICAADGTGGAAFVAKDCLVRSLRPGLRSTFYPEARARYNDISQLLQMVTDPEILFEFGKLVDLFVDYVIPTQMIILDPDKPVLFNPARLAVFGAP